MVIVHSFHGLQVCTRKFWVKSSQSVVFIQPLTMPDAKVPRIRLGHPEPANDGR